jgi:hypothetical protein
MRKTLLEVLLTLPPALLFCIGLSSVKAVVSLLVSVCRMGRATPDGAGVVSLVSSLGSESLLSVLGCSEGGQTG